MRIRRPICAVFPVLYLFLSVLAWSGQSFLPSPPSYEAALLRRKLSGEDGVEAYVTGRICRCEQSGGTVHLLLKTVSIETDLAKAVLSDPDITLSSQEKTRIQTYEKSNRWMQIRENARCRVLAFLRPETEEEIAVLRSGSRVCLKGTLYRPVGNGNPGEIDLRSHDEAQNIVYRMNHTVVIDTLSAGAHGLMTVTDGLFSAMQDSFERIADEKDAGSIRSVLMGDKSGLDQNLGRLFRDGGIAHILAVSGLHVSLFGMSFFRILRRRKFSYTGCFLLSSAVTGLYCLFTGMSLSALRAMLMYWYWALAQKKGRTPDPPTSLALAASIVLILRPGSLKESSFYLSFGCILSIQLVLPLMENLQETMRKMRRRLEKESKKQLGKLQEKLQIKMLQKTPENRLMKNLRRRGTLSFFPADLYRDFLRFAAAGIRLSAAVMIGTLPVTCYFFYQFAPWSILLNLIVVPLMPVLMICGFAAGIAGMLHTGIGQLLFAPCHYLLKLFELLCRMEERLPGAVIITGRPKIWEIALYYLGLLLLIRRTFLRKGDGTADSRGERILRGKSIEAGNNNSRILRSGTFKGKVLRSGIFRSGIFKNGIFLETAVFLAGFLFVLQPSVCRFRAAFLNVGQGDCILLSQGNRHLMIDCGSSSADQVWTYRVKNSLKYYGVRRLEAVCATHGDEDHINGIREILADGQRSLTGDFVTSGIQIGMLITAEHAAGYDEPLKELIAFSEKKGLAAAGLRAGDQIAFGNLTAECLWPGNLTAAQWTSLSSNEKSLVFLAEYTPGSKSTHEEAGEPEKLRMLLTGDLEKEGERLFLEEYKRKYSQKTTPVLKAGHHGSRFATSETMLEILQPRLTVISCGKNNIYGHPSPELLERLETAGVEIHRTDREGAFEIRES